MSELILGAGGMLARGLAAQRPHATALGVGELPREVVARDGAVLHQCGRGRGCLQPLRSEKKHRRDGGAGA